MFFSTEKVLVKSNGMEEEVIVFEGENIMRIITIIMSLLLLFACAGSPYQTGDEARQNRENMLKLNIGQTKGPRRNNFRFSVGADGVVPLGEGVIFRDGQIPHLSISDFDSLLVAPLDQPSTDTKTRVGGGGAGVLEDRLVAIQRAGCPVFAEFTEQAVLDRIPL